MRRVFTVVAASCVFSLAASGEDGPVPIPDFEIAEDAVARGEIIPLREVFLILNEAHPGQVVEVELEYSHGIRIYEVEVITTDGRLIEVELDAADGTILEVELEEEDDDD
ncbi:PepSY domain-containing protein [Amaricoccus tamworthensis]|uniref:PepSY domain-containing protein n=1 Tax=Amaricoccus tamworthensis TaxID=57002 RepID=UPI003C7B451D